LAASLAAAAAASKPLTPAQLKAKQKLDAKDTKRREVREEAGFFFVKDGPVEDLAPKHTVKSKATHRGRAARDEISPATCFDKCFPPGLFQLASTETNRYGRALVAKKRALWQEDRHHLREPLPFKPTTAKEIRVLHGLFIAMTITKFHNLDMYK
jgi:hypothetical protein